MMTIKMMMVVITMLMVMTINFLGGMMAVKTKGSKNLNKRRTLTHCLASVKMVGLVYVRR